MKLGQLLDLPTFHQLYSIPIERKAEQHENYIIVFSQGETLFVDSQSENGQTSQARFASHFTREQLLIGLGAVPLDSLDTCRILDIQPNISHRGATTPYLLENYGSLPHFKKMAERYRVHERSIIFDPYRYSYTVDEKKIAKDRGFTIVDQKDYEKIRDFKPFLQTNRGTIYALPCTYHDIKRQQETKIYIMGWYFYNQQIKISWKPSHSRKARWRSSIIFIDKITDKFFFQGELYKKGSFPIFLENLALSTGTSQKFPAVKQTYDHFLDTVNQQKIGTGVRKSKNWA
ncbi:hypothetical protein HO665_02970 [Streptococcus suis]|nr:hypothetical protein [Streptococcus suis]WNF84478.1 hypothetical protein RJW52_00700 [Streptococcus suis]